MSKFTKLNTVTTFKNTKFSVSKYIKTGTKRTFFAVELDGVVCVKTLFARKYDAEMTAKALING